MGEKLKSPPDNIILSLEDGIVWASWPGVAERVNLGPEEAVAYMMRDFLAQNEVAKRLNPPEKESASFIQLEGYPKGSGSTMSESETKSDL